MFVCYILHCEANRLYVGSCWNVEERFRLHLAGKGADFTKRFPPRSIAYTETFPTRAQAVQREMQIKRWSSEKKRALINGEKNYLRQLAKSSECR